MTDTPNFRKSDTKRGKRGERKKQKSVAWQCKPKNRPTRRGTKEMKHKMTNRITTQQRKHREKMTQGITDSQTTTVEKHQEAQHHKTWPELPCWADIEHRLGWGERLKINEWEGYGRSPGGGCAAGDDSADIDQYRRDNGWKGNDLVHSITSPVRILEYRAQYPNKSGGEGTKLIGVVHFTPQAESHQGFCHGGSMCSIMDDAIGWIGFCVTGKCKPWTGFTVQINTSLMKPVRVGQVLLLRIQIDKVERRKVFASAELVDPDEKMDDGSECVHARGDGLVILNRGVLEAH